MGSDKRTMIDMKRTGQKLKKTCDMRGITVKQIQRELQIGSFQSVYSWFNGKTLPSLDNFYSLCKLLCVPMESMIIECEEYDARKRQIIYTEENNLQMMVRLKAYVSWNYGKFLQKTISPYREESPNFL